MKTSEGDLFSITRGILVHGCNAQGVMGSGVAKQLRSLYPEAYEVYRAEYEKNGLKVGQVVWFRVRQAEPLAIANAITQEFYGRDSSRRYVDYDGLRACFEAIGEVARRHNLPVHYPRVGAGLANGDWSIIAPIIDQALEGCEHRLWVPVIELGPSKSRIGGHP